VVVVVATKFSVKHQGKDIHHPPSIFFSFISLVDPMPFPFPELHNKVNLIGAFILMKWKNCQSFWYLQSAIEKLINKSWILLIKSWKLWHFISFPHKPFVLGPQTTIKSEIWKRDFVAFQFAETSPVIQARCQYYLLLSTMFFGGFGVTWHSAESCCMLL